MVRVTTWYSPELTEAQQEQLHAALIADLDAMADKDSEPEAEPEAGG